MFKYEVFETGKGITCAIMEKNPLRFWVNMPSPPFAWGKFLCAVSTREDGERIIKALKLLENGKE